LSQSFLCDRMSVREGERDRVRLCHSGGGGGGGGGGGEGEKYRDNFLLSRLCLLNTVLCVRVCRVLVCVREKEHVSKGRLGVGQLACARTGKRSALMMLLRVIRSATYYNTLQRTATHCNTLQHYAAHCNTLQHIAAYCSTLQHTAEYSKTLY